MQYVRQSIIATMRANTHNTSITKRHNTNNTNNINITNNMINTMHTNDINNTHNMNNTNNTNTDTHNALRVNIDKEDPFNTSDTDIHKNENKLTKTDTIKTY